MQLKYYNINKIILGMILLIAILPLVNAQDNFGTFKKDSCVTLLQTCSNCSYINITMLLYPNSTIALNDVKMSKVGTVFNYTFCNTNSLGNYFVSGLGDLDGQNSVWNYIFTISATGRESPSGGITVLFIILFIVFILTFCYLIISSLGHFVQLDFDLRDLALNIGLYMSLIAFYYLETNYLGLPIMDDILNLGIYIGAIALAMLPMIYFIVSITVGSYMKRRVKGVDYG
jgi:hypothetical protein